MDVMNVSIPPFSLAWWLGTVLSLAVIAFLIVRLKRLPPEKLTKWEKIIFGLVIAHEILWQSYYIYYGIWDPATSPPLHLCSITKILGAFLMIRFHQTGFEFLMLLGLTGALQAYLTPQIVVKYNLFTHFDFYNNHGWLFFAAFYLFFVKEHELRKNAWLRTFLIGIVVLSIVGVYNYIFEANYIFLAAPPVVDNPLIMGEWPYYIIGFVVSGLFSILLFHWLFSWLAKKLF